MGATVALGLVFAASTPLHAQTATSTNNVNGLPSLIITNEPLPENLRQQIYSKPTQVRAITAKEVRGEDYFQPTQTIVGDKIRGITSDLRTVQDRVASLSANLNGMERRHEQEAADYYANIATINTQLQSGTTPGNPRLMTRLNKAEQTLDELGGSIAQLNTLAADISNTASEASFLLEETRAAYSVSGAVEEDHVHLAQLEDSINNTMIIVQRILNIVNDDITRMSTYLSAERENLRVLSLAVANGDFYGRSLANRPFSGAQSYQPASYSAGAPAAAPAPAVDYSAQQPAPALNGPRPLAKIKFDRPDVAYEEPVYLAVNEALKRYPNARFDLVAVTPTNGNAAQVAIESTKARRNAEQVLRTLVQMGLQQDRVDLAYSESGQAATNEVHLFVK